MSKEVRNIINKLLDHGVIVFLDSGQLKTRSKKGSMSKDVIQLIKSNKNELILYLSNKDQVDQVVNIKRIKRDSAGCELSFAQQRLWFIDQIEKGSAQYNIPTALKLSGELNYKALSQSLTAIVDRHESLRTVFFDSGDGPRQLIQDSTEFDFPVADLSALSGHEQSEQMDLRIAEEANAPFDLSSDLMLRAQLLKLSDAEHILLLTMHHIASDGWSVGLLVNEISQLYQACVKGEANPLPPLPIQYADYAYWQRDWLQGAVLGQQVDYWKQQLSGLPAVHNVPLDHARPQHQTFKGGRVSARLEKDGLNQLNALCSEQGATLFMGLHAAFSILLSRYSGEADIVVGSPIANREQAEVADLIGFFVNTLVLRSDVSGSPSFMTLLQQSKQTALDAYAHQQVPFEQLVEVLQPERSLSHSPLFQVMLVLQNNEQGSLSLPGLTLSPVPQSQIQSKFDVTLSAAELDSGLVLEWEYNTDIFDVSTIERMADHFVVLLNQLIARPNDNVFALDLVSETERENLLTDWNTTKADYPQEVCIHELFEAQVANTPEAIALTFENQQLTYGELNQQANQLAHYLVTEKQVVPDTLVGICLERSLDMVVAILGILKAGGAYVPLDPNYPEARLTYTVQDASLDTVITHSDVLNRIPAIASQALCLDEVAIQNQITAQPTTNVTHVDLRPSHLAYVIYTSGSTGNPKGVLVNHANVTRLFSASEKDFDFSNQDVWTLFHSYAFDFSVWELWGALIYGGRLVVVPYWVARSSSDFYDVLAKEQVTVLNQTPSAFSSLVSIDASAQQALSLRYVIFGGEKLNPAQIVPWFKRHGDQSPQLINMYGITETTVHVTYRRLRLSDVEKQEEKSVIGRPLSDLSAWVLNTENQMVPVGVAGELYVGGAGLTRGYLNRAELTAEKFIGNPFSDNPEDRLYKTGDLVRWLPDGNLEYIGRIDHQVKIRGFRIELGEIENTLLSHEAIQESVVIAREDQAGDKRLVAYVVLNESGTDEELKAEQLNEHITTWRSHLSQSLPEYMVPSSFVVLDNIPLTPNGKVDRNALPEPDVSQQQASYVAPSTETEKLLSAIWQDILGLEQVGVTDNFFRLGGHSLLLIQMLSRLQEAGHPTDVRHLFSANSLGDLAEQLDQAASHEDTDEVFVAPENLIPNECDRITPAMLSLIALAQDDIDLIVNAMPGGASNIQDMYPLAPLQEGILFHHQMSDGKADAYVMPVLLSAKTRAQRDDFLKALQGVVNRHDVLRTAVLWEGLPQAVQVVCRDIELPIEHFVLDPDQAAMPQLQAKMAPAQQWMDIRQAPLLRVHLTEDLQSENYYILLQLHHIISDHVGLEIIQAEVQDIFSDNEKNLSSPVPYREFVAHAKYQSVNLSAEQFFKEKLQGITEPTAPFDLLDVHGGGEDIVEASQQFPVELSRSIRQVSQRLAVSPAAIFHTGFALVVGVCSGRNDVVFGTVLSGRLQGTSGAEKMMGMFINTLPYRFNLEDKTSDEAVRFAQAELSALLTYEQASLVLAQQCSGLPSGTPLFSAMLNYRHSSPGNSDTTDNTGIKVLHAQERSNYPFSISVDDFDEGFALTAQMDKSLDPERMMGYFQTAMHNLVKALKSGSQKHLLDIDVIFEKERHQLLVEWNDTKIDYPQNLCIHELFEAQVEKRPNAIALAYEGEQLSYRELNQEANRLAHYLGNVKAVGPETLVGVCLDRSLDMMIAVLGVLKAGGAYVPLDPEYPEARLKYLIDDAGLDTIITHKNILNHVPVLPQQALCLDDLEVIKNVSEQSDTNIDLKLTGLQSNHLAYVIYTSGSTGNPKGVMIEHKGLVNLVSAQVKRFEVEEESSVVQFASSSFDAAVSEWGMALCAGAKLVLIPSQTPETLHDAIEKESITHATLPPALLPFLDENIWKPVSHIIVAGEHCSRELADKWSKNRKFYNAYGPSESTVCTSIGNYSEGQSCIHIGTPIDNITTYVISNNQLSPPGVIGELHVGGVGLARGYLNRPELTAERFIPNPFSGEAGDRLYKTGDLVRWLQDGNLEYIGRIDHQVKIRGFRIELGEIENTLLSHEAIQDSVVIAREDKVGDKRLVAYVVLNEFGADADTNEYITAWRSYLSESLPEYMVPSSFVVLESIPLTPNGKVDRKALPAPDVSQQQNSYVAPSTDTEKLLCEIWQDVLGLEQIGVSDNFLRLGGHSLLLIQVLARLQDAGHSTNVKRLFGAASLGDLASHLDDLSKSVDPNGKEQNFTAPVNLIPESSEVIVPEMLSLITLTQLEIDKIVSVIPGGAENIQDIYPLAPLQEGILFHHQISKSAGDPYVTNVLLEMKSQKQRQDFLDALKIVINRHDILRSAVLWQGLPQAVQVVCRDVELPIARFEYDSELEIKSHLLEQVESVAHSIDFSKAPLLQAQLAEDPESDSYFILLQLHHIISDHVGLEIVQAEVQAILQGGEHRLTKSIPYREFVAHALHQEKNNNAEEFFREKLGDIYSPSVPFELFDVHGDGNEIIESSQLVPQELSKDVRELSQRMGVTPAAFFHVVFGLVVGACSGRSDLVFGTVLSGRLQGTYGAEEVLGLFINTLPYRLNLKETSVKEILFKAQSELSELLSYEQASLALAQKCSGLPNGTALFSAILNYRHSAPIGVEAPSDLGIKTLAGRERTNYPFTVSIDDYGDAFSFTAQVNNKVDPERVLDYLQTTLKSLLKALDQTPEKVPSTVDVIPNTERDKLLTNWNTTKAGYPQDSCIHELFEAQVAKSPEAIALTFEDQQLTYGELNQKANQLAHYLVTEKQVVPDTLVGICLERSLDMVVAILGILKAGGAYVPLDPDYPEARLSYMLQDSGANTVITHRELLDRTPISPDNAVCLDVSETQDNIAAQATSSPDIQTLNSRHLAYVIYTSGSTGNPKGVMVEHQAIVNRIHWMHTHYGAASRDVFLQKTPFSFDVSVWEFFWPLMAGSQLVIAQPQGHTDPQYLSTLIQAQGVTKLHFVPSMLSAMLVAGTFEACHSVKQVFCSGEALALQHERDFYRVLPESELHNLYGPTEAAVDVSYWACPKTGSGHSSVPIGRPIDNIQLHVLDSHCQLVPQGVVGELHIGGVGLARGYLNRAELTAEKFISNPFSDNLEDRLYKTGDLVRWLPDGNLEYIGRIDHQVKIRGFRIELGEIENTLLSHEAIQESVVIAREDQAGDKRLVAYVVLNESGTDEELKAEQLNEHITTWRSHLSQSLPEYMVPSSFVVLDNIPLTPNGKVDRNALPEPDVSQQQASYVAPSTETEKLLSAIWQDILGLEQVGVTDNFFRLGGHSLLLIQMLSRLQEAGHPTDVRQLFSANSLGELAEQLDQAAGCEDTDEIFVAPENLIPNECDRITPAMLSLIALAQDDIDLIVNAMPGGASNIQDMYPLAPLQEGILFHHQMSDGKADAYVMPVLLSAKTRAQRDDFLKALQGVVNRHDVLRTAVLWEGLPQAVQVVCRDIELPIEHFVLDPDQAAMPQLQAKMAPAQQWMDIRQAPLLRVHLTEDLQSENYYILLQLHHIIDDVTSITMIQSEVQLILAGREDALIEATPYRELVAHALHQAQTSDAETFFREKLGDVSEPTAPFNLLDVHGNGGEIIESSERLTDDLSHDIRHAAQTLGVTPAALFHTAFALVTGICSGRDDVVFGTVLSGRLQGTQGVGHMLGMTINTLPYRLQLREQSVEQSVQQAQNELLALLPYEQSSLALAQQSSGLAHGTPLFSAMLNYRHVVAPNHGVTFDSGIEILSGHERTNYPFTVSIDDLDDGFGITAQVNDQLDPERVVSYIRTAMEQVVTALAQQPEKPLLALDVLPNAEREKLLTDWSGTKANYSQDSCIHELFEAQVAKSPEAIALTFEDQQLTYGELNQKANQLAHYLVNKKQVVPDTLVGICLERSLDMVVAILGILKAGGAYVPLDPDYPEARLKFLIEDTGITTVLTRSEIVNQAHVSLEQALCLNDPKIQSQITAQPNSNVTSTEVRAHHLAYVIYTSGSTGTPKGVTVEHKNVTSLVVNAGYVPLSPTTVMLHNATVTFDAATFELWGALLNGGQLVIQPERVLDMEALGHFIKDHHINTAWMTAGLFDQFISIYHDTVPELRYLLVGGDVVNTHSVEKLLSTNGNIQLINGYGPTENTTFSTTYPIQLTDAQKASIPIGSPLHNRQTYVVDTVGPDVKLTPMGAVGELYVGGEGLSRGYLNRPELTAEKFIENPFSDNEQDRLYKTGDLVRWLSDGSLEYMGRADAQVKIRGFRVELGEIEKILLSHEGIRDCVVIAREDQSGDKRLVAYVVPDEAINTDMDIVVDSQYLSVWRDYLSQNLPEYMVPSSFVALDGIPLTSNGKVDRKALPAPDLSQKQEHYLAPSTATEQFLCEIWQDILGLEQVGVTDNFFHLGGHSLIATQIVSRIQKKIGVTVPVQTLFETPTIQGVEKKIKEIMATAGEKKTEIKPIPEHERSVGVRLSHTQQRLWFIDQLERGSAKYNMPLSFLMEGEVDVVALEYSIKGIIERHAVLRTSFEKQGDVPIQLVHDEFDFKLQVSDFCDIGDNAILQDKSNTLISQLGVEPFSLNKAPLLRAHLIKQENDRCILVLVMHHIVSDGWSFGIVLSELAELYRSYKLGRSASLPPLQFQYSDYAHWQRLPENEKEVERQMSYWETSLKGLPVLSTFPSDKPRPAQPTFRGTVKTFSLSSSLSREVSKVCTQNGVSLYMVFLALLSVLISKYARQSDIAIGSPIANRRDSDLESLIGYFANTLVMRTEVDNKKSLRALLTQVKENTLQVYENQDVPFDKIVEALNPVRSINHEPLFQVMLAVHNMPSEESSLLPGLTISPLEIDRVSSLYDLTVNITESADSIDFGFEYNTELFKAKTIEKIFDHMVLLTEALVDDIDCRISNISLLSEVEIADMQSRFNKTDREFPQDLCIHQLFERSVENHPQKRCVTHNGDSISYDLLNKRANKVAHYLIDQGITPDSFVGVCLDRSIEMMVALIAILKSGASYIPLDPAYPESRLMHMLADSGVRFILTKASLAVADLFDDKCVSIDVGDTELFDRFSSNNIDPSEIGFSSNSLSYVIYTSGSTGKPKGVMVSHKSVVNMLYAMKESPGMSEKDKILAAASISFDMHVMEIYLPLLVGAELVLSSEEQGRNPAALSNLIESERITMMQGTPSTWKMLQNTQWQPEERIKIICGGEALDEDLKHYLVNLPTVELWNLYGPTEACVWVSAKKIVNRDDPVTLAGPINNTQFLVLDEALNVVPVGVAGELHLGGVGLAQGYLNRGELTNEKFICNPFNNGERLYKTGDLVRWLENGELEFLGRTDHQVKIRGYRIELGEITSVIKTHTSVRDAVVIDVYKPNSEHELIAYVVAVSEGDVNLDEMRKHIANSLPPYMQPQEFIVIDEIPLSPNKKVDRNALIQSNGLRLSVEHVMPETEREIALISIWKEILGERKFGVQDNFFEVGGNSILLVKLQSEIERKMGVSVEMMDLFRYPTVRTIVDYLESSPREENVHERSQERASSRHKAMQKRRNKRREKV